MKRRTVFISCITLVCFFVFFTADRIAAQAVTPQKVTAVYDGTLAWIFEDCPHIPMKITVEAWNVGSAGGGNYGDATVIWDSFHCNVDSKGNDTKGDPLHFVFNGTFSGGPDGVLTFSMASEGFEGDSRVLFAGGTTAKMVFTHSDGQAVVDLKVVNPQAFGDEFPEPTEEPTLEPTPGSPCTPVISNISGLKPGDTLSPAVEYVDAEGKNVGALSSVWYINGVQANSTAWDGRETALILQYTCPDHSAHEKRLTVPAYDGSKTSSQAEDSGGLLKTGLLAGGAVAGAAGAAGAAAAGAYTAAQIARPKNPTPRPLNRPATSRPASSPRTLDPQGPPPQRRPPADLPRPESPPPARKGLSFEEQVPLQNRLDELDEAVIRLTKKFNDLGVERELLLAVFKTNGLKFFAKKAIQTAGKVVTSPAEAVLSPVVDKAMENIVGMHDTTGDANNIVRTHAELQSRRMEMRETYEEAMRLKTEAARIRQQLKELGK